MVLRFILKLIKEEASRKTDKDIADYIYIDYSKLKTSKSILSNVFQKLKNMDYKITYPLNKYETIVKICWDID